MSLRDQFRGKVISLVGSPASGKTYLGNVLQEKLNADILYEHPAEGFPGEIKENLKKQTNLLETILYFRNIQIENHLKAQEIALNGKTVIIDTPFYQNQLFIDLYITNHFNRDILYKLGDHDLKAYDPSDVTIYIKTTGELVKEFLKKRHGERIWEKNAWYEFISQMPPKVDLHMNKIKGYLKNLITVRRDLFDFAKKEDRQELFDILSDIKM